MTPLFFLSDTVGFLSDTTDLSSDTFGFYKCKKAVSLEKPNMSLERDDYDTPRTLPDP